MGVNTFLCMRQYVRVCICVDVCLGIQLDEKSHYIPNSLKTNFPLCVCGGAGVGRANAGE